MGGTGSQPVAPDPKGGGAPGPPPNAEGEQERKEGETKRREHDGADGAKASEVRQGQYSVSQVLCACAHGIVSTDAGCLLRAVPFCSVLFCSALLCPALFCRPSGVGIGDVRSLQRDTVLGAARLG